MSGDYREDYCKERRVFLLRRLVELSGEANAAVLRNAAIKVYPASTPDDVRTDFRHLKEQECIEDEWLSDTIRMIKITERGENAALGKVHVAGVHQSRWKPSDATPLKD